MLQFSAEGVEGYISGAKQQKGYVASFTWNDPEKEAITTRTYTFSVHRQNLRVPAADITTHTNNRLFALPQSVHIFDMELLNQNEINRLNWRLGKMALWLMYDSYRDPERDVLIEHPVAIDGREVAAMISYERGVWRTVLR